MLGTCCANYQHLQISATPAKLLLTAVNEMSSRIDNLESAIGDLMQSGVDTPTQP